MLKPANKEELKKIIENRIRTEGSECDLNDIDVSDITDMSGLFYGKGFNFYEHIFNGNVSKWDVSNVTNMRGMFEGSNFTGDISKWDVSNVTNMSSMFSDSQFTGDISKWKVSKVTDMSRMFSHSQFTGDISKWNISANANIAGIFKGVENNQPKGNLDAIQNLYHKILDSARDSSGRLIAVDNDHLKRIVHAAVEFNGCNCDLNFVDVSQVTDMSDLFCCSNFTGDISKWDVSNVTNMSDMFSASQFDGDISEWDVSNVTNMSGMFRESPFNGDIISNWNIRPDCDTKDMFDDK